MDALLEEVLFASPTSSNISQWQDLLKKLLEEPFSDKYRLSDLTFLEMGEFLEAINAYEDRELLKDILISDSHVRVVELYCQLMMLLEEQWQGMGEKYLEMTPKTIFHSARLQNTK